MKQREQFQFGPCRAVWVALGLLATVILTDALPNVWLSASAYAADAPPLRWAADAEGGAPYIFKDPSQAGRHVGFEVELSEALARELGRPVEFKQYTFESLVSGLERGDFDFAMNGLEVTPTRAERLRMSRPYYRCYLQLVARADDTRFETIEQIKKFNGLVGTMGETRSAWMLEDAGVKAKMYDGQAEPFQDLVLGRVDAVLLDYPITVYYGRPNPKLKLVGKPVNPGLYAIAFRRADEQLAQQCDAALLRIGRSGELKKICEKWQIWTEDQATLFDDDQPKPFVDVVDEARKQWTFSRYFPLLRDAALITIELSLASMTLAMIIGLPVALCRLYGPWPLRLLAVGYVEFFRGIPVLLLLYLLYYGLPSIMEQANLGVAFKPSDFTVAILAFGMNYAAFESEIYRAGLAAIPQGQWEAAASLGMSSPTTFRRIILPQALRMIIPPVTNDFVALFKDTSLVSVIGVVELTKQYQMLSKSSMKYLEIGLATAGLYLLMSVPLGYLARRLEKRWQA